MPSTILKEWVLFAILNLNKNSWNISTFVSNFTLIGITTEEYFSLVNNNANILCLQVPTKKITLHYSLWGKIICNTFDYYYDISNIMRFIYMRWSITWKCFKGGGAEPHLALPAYLPVICALHITVSGQQFLEVDFYWNMCFFKLSILF